MTRERILSAARREFAREGFGGAKVHAIAASSGVSPNLITRYFGSKNGLFIAATDVRLNLDARLEGPRETFGERLAKAIVDRWTSQEGEDPLLALLRAAGEHAQAGAVLSTFLDEQSLAPLTRRLLLYGMSEEEANARARSIDIFVVGVTTRYRMLRDQLDDVDALERWIAGSIQALIDVE
ncbi:TetR/AcrR family transcriptional regulator [Aureimonas sp. AU20]|uniref:TetR/AcrR family transcriptional regulator n=1 Tax=Aureimonas sp. AU20 TaxID=1349819 RepID=UPI000722586F|nr:TetR/AcrR family transcriptional regulator [Aureimonas sp. AU20]ALN73090.1 hypothetical protein M673_10185 [Aureimonas sp. AU20]